MSIREFFPHESIRESQHKVLDIMEKTDKRFIILEAPTGTGKSPLAIALAQYLRSQKEGLLYRVDGEDFTRHSGAFLLTITKQLQQQYMSSYPNHVHLLKAKKNYKCPHHGNCLVGRTVWPHEKKKILEKHPSGVAETMVKQHECNDRNCTYLKAKKAFVSCDVGITNFAYFLTETMHVGELKPRQLLILDECHRVESVLMNSISQKFSKMQLRKLYGLSMPVMDDILGYCEWMNEVLLPASISRLRHLSDMLKEAMRDDDSEEVKKVVEDIASENLRQCRISSFVGPYKKDPEIILENWVMNVSKQKQNTWMEFKPIDVSNIAHKALLAYGEKVLLMSATICGYESYIKSLGIDKSKCEFISVGSEFPPENRPVFVHPIVHNTHKNKHIALPAVTDVISAILEEWHPDEKGIIHTHTYDMQDYLLSNMPRKQQRRLLTHSSEDRDEVLEYHLSSSKPTVLVSPSMEEGVDLADDHSRFQIICKVPYPYLGDKQVKAKMKKCPGWYEWMTAIILVQAFGRSIRSKDDFASTYILDAMFDKFYSSNRKLFPEWINFIWE